MDLSLRFKGSWHLCAVITSILQFVGRDFGGNNMHSVQYTTLRNHNNVPICQYSNIKCFILFQRTGISLVNGKYCGCHHMPGINVV